MSYPYALDSIAGNPYFQMAYNSPGFYGAPNQVAPQNITSTPIQQPDAENKTETSSQEDKKEHTTAKLIIGTALTTGAAILCKKAYKAGTGKNAGTRILNGIKQWCTNSQNKINNILKPEVFSIKEENGKILCTIPNRTNRLSGEKAIQELGLSNEIPIISKKANDGTYQIAKGIKIKKGTITVDGKTYNVKNGKIINTTEPTGEKVHELLKKLNNGEQAEGIKIEEFLHTENGTTRVFTNTNGTFNLRLAISNKHNINSPIVKQYRGNNEKINNTLNDYLINGNKEGLKIASAEIPTEYGTILTKNGENIGIEINGKLLKKGSTEYDALFYDHKKELETAIKNKDSYKNIVYQMA